MIRLRRGIVLEVRPRSPGVSEAQVEVEGGQAPALAYLALTGPVEVGDRVVLNTTAIALGLGTGGVHLVVAVEDGVDLDPEEPGHAMKLRYTPLQVKIAPVEETHRVQMEAFEGLRGTPVVVAGLHSALAAAAIGARATAPGVRVAYVMTDGGALPAAFSLTVPALRTAGLLDATITCGQAFGGDFEAINVYSGIAAAREVAGAGVIIAAMGPGNLGTGSRLGFALLETVGVINAVAALGGRPVVVPRLSFADPRERHRGVSHHTLTALSLALAPAEIALPPLAPDRAESVRRQLQEIVHRHRIVEVDLGPAENALRSSPVPLRSMGRSFEEDPDCFRAAAAAGALAAQQP